MELGIDPEELGRCVGCGLCLSHCPTYRVTGDEAMSPRGRIRLMRELQEQGAPLTDELRESLTSCVQCRGCETACPSGVNYGLLIEETRASLAEQGELSPWWQRLALDALAQPRTLRAGSRVIAAAQRVSLVPARLGLPRLPLRDEPLVTRSDTGGPRVWFFTGCVMDAWQRSVHRDAVAVLEAAGADLRLSGDEAPCCGALHVHAGLPDRARVLAEQVMAALPGDEPILVDSAGCGAALKDYGRLLGTPAAEAFSERVEDLAEWLAPRVGLLPAAEPLELRVAVQDPCHLRHVQRVHLAVRELLAPFVTELRELDDEGLCCGAGGAYSVLEPELSGAIRERKLASIARADCDVVASANPGCAMHLAAGGAPTEHPITLVARSLGLSSSRT